MSVCGLLPSLFHKKTLNRGMRRWYFPSKVHVSTPQWDQTRLFFLVRGIGHHLWNGLNTMEIKPTLLIVPQGSRRSAKASAILIKYSRLYRHLATPHRKTEDWDTVDDLKRRTSTTERDPSGNIKIFLHLCGYARRLLRSQNFNYWP